MVNCAISNEKVISGTLVQQHVTGKRAKTHKEPSGSVQKSFHLWEASYLQSQDDTMALEVEKMKMTKLKTETSIQSKSYRHVQAKLLHKYFRVCCK